MSRELPRRPSLDHLKKQAKELLRELRLREPGTSLSEAQHALAKEYGFASWPRLKAHVEAAAAEPAAPPLAFHRFTEKARQALFFSRFEAARCGSVTIEPGHMLLGLLRASQDMTRSVFAGASISLDTARARVVGQDAPAPLAATVIIPFGVETQRAVRAAIAEADALRHDQIGVAHLVLGMLRDRSSVATAVLHDAGLRVDTVRRAAAERSEREPEA